MAAGIAWTYHAQERQSAWEKRLGASCPEIESVLRYPAQVVAGERGLQVAQRRRGQGLLRVVFAESQSEVAEPLPIDYMGVPSDLAVPLDGHVGLLGAA